jgi:hypothetical protein
MYLELTIGRGDSLGCSWDWGQEHSPTRTQEGSCGRIRQSRRSEWSQIWCLLLDVSAIYGLS